MASRLEGIFLGWGVYERCYKKYDIVTSIGMNVEITDQYNLSQIDCHVVSDYESVKLLGEAVAKDNGSEKLIKRVVQEYTLLLLKSTLLLLKSYQLIIIPINNYCSKLFSRKTCILCILLRKSTTFSIVN